MRPDAETDAAVAQKRSRIEIHELLEAEHVCVELHGALDIAHGEPKVVDALGRDAIGHAAPGMTLRARGARRRRGDSPRRKEEGTVKVCPEAGRGRRLMPAHLGAPAGGPTKESVAPRPPGREHSSRML